MKVIVLQENLQQALQHVIKAVPSRPQLSILSSILVTTTSNGLLLAATDLYMGIRVEVLGQTLEEGSVVVPAKTFLDSIQSFSAGQIELELKENTLKLTTKSGVIKVQGQSSEEYPEFPAPSGQQVNLNLEQLNMIDTYVRFAVSVDPSRVILTALLMLFSENQVKIVGTDGFRLAILEAPLVEAVGVERLLLPARALSEVCRIANHEKVNQIAFFISQELKQLSFKINTTEMFVRLIEGDFPPFEKIIPSHFEVEAVWDGDEFAAQVRRALIFAREASNIIRLTLEPTQLKISAKSAAFGEYEGQMPIKNPSGATNHIAFNGRYVLDFITNAKPKQIWFGMNDSLKPAMLKIGGRDDFSYIVMPFRVND